MGQWLDDFCKRDPNVGDSTARLFESWRQFATGQGEAVGTKRWFTQALRTKGFH